MYRGVWYTGAINEEEGSDMPMEDMLELPEGAGTALPRRGAACGHVAVPP